MEKFVKTSDKDTADKLLAEGLQLVSSDSSGWIFINDAKKTAKFKKENMVFTSILAI